MSGSLVSPADALTLHQPTAPGSTASVVDATDVNCGTQRLIDFPDWSYLLQEIYSTYRYSSAGGSPRIRAHQRAVRERLNKTLRANPQMVFTAPEAKPVCAHLGRAIDNGEADRMFRVVKAIAKITDRLTWRYGYDRMPRGLQRKYAYADLLGPEGPVFCESLVIGVVLFAPRTTYPQHSHPGITESYFCLSGSVSENEVGVYVPGSMILNLPGHEHVITTPEREPVLLVYAWIGEPNLLRSPLMTFSRRTRKTSIPSVASR